MAEHGQRTGLAGEPLGKGGLAADRRREDFQGHQPIEVFLPGLVDHAHPAPADKLDDFKLGEQRRQFGGRRRLDSEKGTGPICAERPPAGTDAQSWWSQRTCPLFRRRTPGFAAPTPALEQAAGAKPLRGVGGQLRFRIADSGFRWA